MLSDRLRQIALAVALMFAFIAGATVLVAASPGGSAAASTESGTAPVAPRVVLATSLGDIVLEFFPEKAPATVRNFLAHVEQGFYDGTILHRVVDGFIIQGGGYLPDMRQKLPPYPPIPLESRNGLRNLRGTVAMARGQEAGSATCQFFFNLADNPSLDNNPAANPTGYAVFGRVVEGMDVLDRIRGVEVVRNPADVQQDGSLARSLPATPIVIKSARVRPAGD
mgnify:CR=1 FL=1